LSFTIAVSGKGGTGKTTIAGLIIGYLQRRGKIPILVVDADPNANLNEALGIKYQITIGGAREQMKTEVPPGITKNIWIESKIQEALVEAKDYDLLVMGRPEGSGCYCVANALVRNCVDCLSKNYQYVVIDNEAGMEHFSRFTTQDVDLLFIISDPTVRGLQTAWRILDLIRELKISISQSIVLINQIRNGVNLKAKGEIDRLQLQIGGSLSFDENVYQYDLEGKPTYNLPESSPAVRELGKILDKLIK
jgi:CO dehydrogenase maturation factor